MNCGCNDNKKNKLRVAVLVSGSGTNLQALIDYERNVPACPYTICSVLSDRKDAFALSRVAGTQIATHIVSPFAVLGAERAKAASRDEKRFAVSAKVLEHCLAGKIEAIVLAGFLTVLGGDIINEYSGKIVNLHPSLLPKFGGVGMWGQHVHEAVIAAREQESGCTVHLVDSGCDTGQILVQKKVIVLDGDTPEKLAARIAPVEHEAIVEGVCLLAKKLFY